MRVSPIVRWIAFVTILTEVLKRRYRDHWFPERPFKGSGYRCIRINGRLDPVISQAAEDSAISTKLLRKSFPSELTMWIDPKEVSYRIGENGSICVLYEYSDLSASQQPWAPQSSLESKVNNSNSNHNNSTTTTTNKNIPAKTHNNIKPPSCGKESLRNIDYLLDPRRSTLSSMEQLTAYVSS
ncbi:TOB [Lepeophtheirus salmonis]|uniref:TOB n=1 Tax=Lepeophtheirus salmonis TaxID=72036 RepID=A0A7R8CJ24_LEPSM|nr:TOB [Lepeophtheirus salmonis]CAF2838410.1 TOB [Lepeophtheirus salmonis]